MTKIISAKIIKINLIKSKYKIYYKFLFKEIFSLRIQIPRNTLKPNHKSLSSGYLVVSNL